MKVSEKDVAYVAQLANLELTAEEQSAMLRDLNSILGYVDRLAGLDTANVPPMAQIQTGRPEGQADSVHPYDAAREDVVQGLRPSLPREETFANAPETDGAFFLVPKVIERA